MGIGAHRRFVRACRRVGRRRASAGQCQSSCVAMQLRHAARMLAWQGMAPAGKLMRRPASLVHHAGADQEAPCRIECRNVL